MGVRVRSGSAPGAAQLIVCAASAMGASMYGRADVGSLRSIEYCAPKLRTTRVHRFSSHLVGKCLRGRARDMPKCKSSINTGRLNRPCTENCMALALPLNTEIGGVVQTPEEDHRAALEELRFKLKRHLRL